MALIGAMASLGSEVLTPIGLACVKPLVGPGIVLEVSVLLMYEDRIQNIRSVLL